MGGIDAAGASDAVAPASVGATAVTGGSAGCGCSSDASPSVSALGVTPPPGGTFSFGVLPKPAGSPNRAIDSSTSRSVGGRGRSGACRHDQKARPCSEAETTSASPRQ
jgi:hypothetical protein